MTLIETQPRAGVLKGKGAKIWERDELDWYIEPIRATEALLTVERFCGGIHDPCAGGGNIVTTLRAAGYDASGSDVVDRAGFPDWFCGVADFLTDEAISSTNYVFNPPFFRAKGAEAFIRKALALAGGKVCAFVDIRFIAGAQRANGLFKDHPPSRIHVITPRVSCPPGSHLAAGGKAQNGTSDWCWLVWSKTEETTHTTFGWLRSPRDGK